MVEAETPTSAALVTTAWLADHLHDRDLVVVDGSYHLPALARDARAEYRNEHIPGAVFFDIDAIADHASALPHMVPNAADFAAKVGALGIGETDVIVVYDTLGLFSAARVAWTFRIFGAKRVFILDGGLPKWKRENRPVEASAVSRAPRTFHATLTAAAVAHLADVRAALADGTAQVVDARSAARFAGRAPEPRPGLRSGHMPGAFNVPYTRLVTDGRLAPRTTIEAAFAEAGVDLTKPVITTCGSGLTAAILTLAVEAVGGTPKALYDGSWSEWGSRDDLPVDRD